MNRQERREWERHKAKEIKRRSKIILPTDGRMLTIDETMALYERRAKNPQPYEVEITHLDGTIEILKYNQHLK